MRIKMFFQASIYLLSLFFICQGFALPTETEECKNALEQFKEFSFSERRDIFRQISVEQLEEVFQSSLVDDIRIMRVNEDRENRKKPFEAFNCFFHELRPEVVGINPRELDKVLRTQDEKAKALSMNSDSRYTGVFLKVHLLFLECHKSNKSDEFFSIFIKHLPEAAKKYAELLSVSLKPVCKMVEVEAPDIKKRKVEQNTDIKELIKKTFVYIGGESNQSKMRREELTLCCEVGIGVGEYISPHELLLKLEADAPLDVWILDHYRSDWTPVNLSLNKLNKKIVKTGDRIVIRKKRPGNKKPSGSLRAEIQNIVALFQRKMPSNTFDISINEHDIFQLELAFIATSGPWAGAYFEVGFNFSNYGDDGPKVNVKTAPPVAHLYGNELCLVQLYPHSAFPSWWDSCYPELVKYGSHNFGVKQSIENVINFLQSDNDFFDEGFGYNCQRYDPQQLLEKIASEIEKCNIKVRDDLKSRFEATQSKEDIQRKLMARVHPIPIEGCWQEYLKNRLMETEIICLEDGLDSEYSDFVKHRDKLNFFTPVSMLPCAKVVSFHPFLKLNDDYFRGDTIDTSNAGTVAPNYIHSNSLLGMIGANNEHPKYDPAQNAYEKPFGVKGIFHSPSQEAEFAAFDIKSRNDTYGNFSIDSAGNYYYSLIHSDKTDGLLRKNAIGVELVKTERSVAGKSYTGGIFFRIRGQNGLVGLESEELIPMLEDNKIPFYALLPATDHACEWLYIMVEEKSMVSFEGGDYLGSVNKSGFHGDDFHVWRCNQKNIMSVNVISTDVSAKPLSGELTFKVMQSKSDSISKEYAFDNPSFDIILLTHGVPVSAMDNTTPLATDELQLLPWHIKLHCTGNQGIVKSSILFKQLLHKMTEDREARRRTGRKDKGRMTLKTISNWKLAAIVKPNSDKSCDIYIKEKKKDAKASNTVKQFELKTSQESPRNTRRYLNRKQWGVNLNTWLPTVAEDMSDYESLAMVKCMADLSRRHFGIPQLEEAEAALEGNNITFKALTKMMTDALEINKPWRPSQSFLDLLILSINMHITISDMYRDYAERDLEMLEKTTLGYPGKKELKDLAFLPCIALSGYSFLSPGSNENLDHGIENLEIIVRNTLFNMLKEYFVRSLEYQYVDKEAFHVRYPSLDAITIDDIINSSRTGFLIIAHEMTIMKFLFRHKKESLGNSKLFSNITEQQRDVLQSTINSLQAAVQDSNPFELFLPFVFENSNFSKTETIASIINEFKTRIEIEKKHEDMCLDSEFSEELLKYLSDQKGKVRPVTNRKELNGFSSSCRFCHKLIFHDTPFPERRKHGGKKTSGSKRRCQPVHFECQPAYKERKRKACELVEEINASNPKPHSQDALEEAKAIDQTLTTK